MYVRAHLVIKISPDLLKALERALKPDNEAPPKNFSIRTYIDNEGLHLILMSEGRANPTAILETLSVIDEVLQLAKSLVEAVVKAGIVNSYKPSIAKEE